MTEAPKAKNPSHLFKRKPLPKKLGDPIPCRLCYYPLDGYGCCIACERRAEAEVG